MPQSFRKQLENNGGMEKFLEDCRIWGRERAMTKRGWRCDPSVSRLLEEETGNPNYGVLPLFGSNCHLDPNANQNVGDILLEAMLRKIQRLEDRLVEVDKQIALKDSIVESYQRQRGKDFEAQVARIAVACEV